MVRTHGLHLPPEHTTPRGKLPWKWSGRKTRGWGLDKGVAFTFRGLTESFAAILRGGGKFLALNTTNYSWSVSWHGAITLLYLKDLFWKDRLWKAHMKNYWSIHPFSVLVSWTWSLRRPPSVSVPPVAAPVRRSLRFAQFWTLPF